MKLKRKLNQRATYWVADGIDKSMATTYSAGVQIDCRFENRQELVKTLTREVNSFGRFYTDDSGIQTAYNERKQVMIASGEFTGVVPDTSAVEVLHVESAPNRSNTQVLYMVMV